MDPPDGAEHIDLENTPWRWEDSVASTILMDNVLEHLSPRSRTTVIEECHRVLKPGGNLVMRLPVPEIGAGWDLTHEPVPSWRWPLHPRWRGSWEVRSVEGSRVGPGRAMPESLARVLTRFWIARCVDEVEVVVGAVR